MIIQRKHRSLIYLLRLSFFNHTRILCCLVLSRRLGHPSFSRRALCPLVVFLCPPSFHVLFRLKKPFRSTRIPPPSTISAVSLYLSHLRRILQFAASSNFGDWGVPRQFHWCLGQNMQNVELIVLSGVLSAVPTVEDPSIARCSKIASRYPGSPYLNRRPGRAHSNAPLDPDGVNNSR